MLIGTNGRYAIRRNLILLSDFVCPVVAVGHSLVFVGDYSLGQFEWGTSEERDRCTGMARVVPKIEMVIICKGPEGREGTAAETREKVARLNHKKEGNDVVWSIDMPC